jgi:hypothetical protein
MPRSEDAYSKTRLFLGLSGVFYLFAAIVVVATSPPDTRDLFYFVATLVAFMGFAMLRRAIAGWKDESSEIPRVYTKHPPESNFP